MDEQAEKSDNSDASDIETGQAYSWHDWCLVRGKDCVYVWCWAAALELSNGSNGWFRFILDGKLATMYSSGSPEGGTDNSGKYLQEQRVLKTPIHSIQYIEHADCY